MARIVLGIGSTHSPQLSTPDTVWGQHADRDRANDNLFGIDARYHTYADLLATADPAIAEEITQEAWRAKYHRSQEALTELADSLAEAAPDVVLIVGDDQRELFLDDGTPAFALYLGASLWDHPPTEEEIAALPPSIAAAQWAQHAAHDDEYLVHDTFSTHLAEVLCAADFDVTVYREQPAGRSLGHAFTFVRQRLGLRSDVPIVPIFVNTYYPPNVPSVRRAFEFGQGIRRGIESWAAPLRVAVVASGGLSHFVVDQELDRGVLDALHRDDIAALFAAADAKMHSGSSEMLNWVTAGGILRGLPMRTIDYIPAYRTEAGTGVGMGFVLWSPDEGEPDGVTGGGETEDDSRA